MAKKATSDKQQDTSKKAAKPAVKAAKKTAAETEVETVASVVPAKKEAPKMRKHGDVNVDVYAVSGEKSGTVSLPESVFAAKINPSLMAQAVRVYLTNQREGSASSKTRSEVDGSSKKIYKQKGTGRARHGTIRAPIFVKGGVALGPKPHDFRLDLPKKMKREAVASAFTSQLVHDSVRIITDAEKAELKTKVFASLFTSLQTTRKTLVLITKEERSIRRAIRNIKYIDVMDVQDAHTYAVLHHKHVVLTKQAIKALEEMYK